MLWVVEKESEREMESRETSEECLPSAFIASA